MTREVHPSLLGKLIYHLLPLRRRVILANLERVFGAELSRKEIVRLAQATYAHFARLLAENVCIPRLSAARRDGLLRVENMETFRAADALGKGVLLLTGHLGNWEVAPVLWLERFPEYRHRSHVIRRPIRLAWIEKLVTGRYRRAGFSVVPKTGSLACILERVLSGAIMVFTLDQHAAAKDGVMVDFFGHPARSFKGLALVARRTGAPVLPLRFWRDPDGTQVLRFEAPLPEVDGASLEEVVRASTQAYNHELERFILEHPEQWIWMHRRWKRPRQKR